MPTTTTPTTTDAVRFTTAPTAPFTPTPVTLTPATVLVVRWAGRGGVRGSAASHRTETVVDVTTTDGVRGVLTLTGGAYRDGAATRTLATHRADGRPSSQILDAYPVGAVVAALAAAMGVTPTTPDADDADGWTCDGCELCDATLAALATDDADDADHADADDDATTPTTPATTITGGRTVAAPMVGAVSTGGALSWDREDYRTWYADVSGRAARRARAVAKRAARRSLRRGERHAWRTGADRDA